MNKPPGLRMKLVLGDGTELSGTSFGSNQPIVGELVFNTAMTGYIETLTDPSYSGQILVTTYPLIGNYGVPAPREKQSVLAPFESDHIQVLGLVVQNYVDTHNHHASTRSLSEWLLSENIPAVTGIDTRTLTRKLREHGTMPGLLYPETMTVQDARNQAHRVEMTREVFQKVAPQKVIHYPGGDLKVMVIDVGAKDNIIRSLQKRNVTVIRAPWHAPIEQLANEVDGIMIGNGPGDPKDLEPLVLKVRNLLGHYTKPIFGICLGNQILARAAGADTYKLPYGHRGVNQPVQDMLTRRSYITSQNHGYAVKDSTLPQDFEPWFVNINDGTNEGIRSRSKPFFSVQFHPEACPGPEDTNFLFDDFLRLVGAMRGA